MQKKTNTEVSIAEIMDAISLRVVWAIVKKFGIITLLYTLIFGLSNLLDYSLGWDDKWNPVWGIPVCIIWLWGYLYETTKNRSLHREQWYFPKTNWLTSLILSIYVVFALWGIISLEKDIYWIVMYYILLGAPSFAYYILYCGYYIVMTQRFPSYRFEDFAIPMPSVLYEISLKKEAMNGNDEDEDDAQGDY